MLDFARIAASSMLNSVLPGLWLFGLAWLLTRIIGRGSSAALRFSIWLIALCAIAILPWVGPVGASSYAPGLAHSTVAFTLPQDVAKYVFVAWILGAALGLAHLIHGLYRLMRLRATCRPMELDTLDPLLRNTLADVPARRSVRLCVSDAIRVPAALGYLRPMVVFPAWALTETPPQQLNAILLHELAHLCRYDDWTNLAQKFAKAVFFFHPAVWFIESRLTLEREMACDEAVLAANFSPRDYAESLVSLAERSFLRRGIELAQAAVGHVKQLRLRLVEILRRDRQGSVRTRKSAVAILAVAAVVSTFAVSRAPLLVRFSADNTATRTARISSPQSAIEPHLQPVSLKYTDHPQPATPLHALAPARVQPRHHKTPKGGPAFIKRVAVNSIPAELPIPALLLANFPIELTPAPVVMVFQGGELGPDGPVLWRVTLFRLSPVQRRVLAGGIPKQI